MEKYGETETAVQEAKREYEQFIADRQLRQAELDHEMMLHDWAQNRKDGWNEGLTAGRTQGLTEGRTQGLTEGRTQGLREASLAIAKKLKDAGMSSEQIITLTGVSEKDLIE